MLGGASPDTCLHEKVRLNPLYPILLHCCCMMGETYKRCRKGVDPDFSEALIVRHNSTIEDVCDALHRSMKESFKYALVWGASARHIPQRVGLSHVVADEDVVSIVGSKSGLATR